MEHNDIVFLRKSNQFLIERIRRHDRSRVIRIRNHHELRPMCHLLRNIRKTDHVTIFFFLRHIVKLCTCQTRTIRKNRIAWIRHQDQVSLIHNGHGNVGQSLLGTEQRTNLRIRVQVHAVAALIPLRNSLQEVLLVIDSVNVIVFISSFLTEHIQNVLCRRNIRRSDA